ncbi:MAG: transposase [Nitrososphaeria archaeon]
MRRQVLGCHPAHRIRDTVESVKPETLFAMLDGALGSTLDDLKSRHIFDMPVVAAIDKHKIPRYDADIDHGFLIRSERGTSTYETYITLQSVEEGKRAQITCRHVSAFSTNAEEVVSLLICSRLNGIDISLLLMDREFFSSEVINALKKNRQYLLVPCKLTSGIKRAIAEYERHERPAVSTYTEEERATFTLVILKRNERYLAFATNMPKEKALWNISTLPEEYRKRWGIETGYNGIEHFRARTTSRNHSLRILYFYYALILYNAWLLANLEIARKFTIKFGIITINMPLLSGIFYALFIEYLRKIMVEHL